MAMTVKDAQADVAVIQRQALIVQTALSELMRSTYNDHVVEAVRLPELVSQTLEIVPDACRQRLVVDADESLGRVGVVRVARTVLRLVLQNLIINAADAVRDAGRDTGVLRVAAEIVREPAGEQLHLHCKDNGVGIPKDNLERVFDRGFSTKSRDTNYGIGLHWCANAIAALGGRIWAASEGPGLGASMHLMVPLTIRET
jgi:C4-dicarboxylate-specific signal transduction histidine kinase